MLHGEILVIRLAQYCHNRSYTRCLARRRASSQPQLVCMTRSGLTAANPAPTSAAKTATASPAATDQSKKDFFRRSCSVRPEILFSSKEATTQDAPSLKSIARPGRPAVSSQPSANQEIDTMRSINDMTASWLPLPYAKGETAMSKAKTGAWLFCALATLVLSGTPSAS